MARPLLSKIRPIVIAVINGLCFAANMLLWGYPAKAADLKSAHMAIVSAVDRVGNLTTHSGQIIRLSNIALPLESTAAYQDSLSWLTNQTLGKLAGIAGKGARQDRLQRWIGDVFVGDTWLQGDLALMGLAFIVPDASQPESLNALIARESYARHSRLGIWDSSEAPVASPATAHQFIGTYRIITGRIIDASRVKTRVYLNFGDDYRQDFTVRINGRLRHQIDRSGDPPEDWDNRLVEVRGLLLQENGPLILLESQYHLRRIKSP